MEIITKVHQDILDYLRLWSEKERNENGINPYFYLRRVRDKRFKEGYWFPGNEDYLCISFWLGGDAYSKTPNIFLNIDLKKGISLRIVSRDSVLKFEFLSNMAMHLNSIGKSNPILERKTMWIKFYSKNSESYLDDLRQFIEEYKDGIDLYIKEKYSDVILDEFIQPIGFIEASEFEESLSRVDKERHEIYKKEDIKKRKELSKPKLPITLNSFVIENYQGILKAFIYNLPSDAPWIFITGENGFGKTSVLQSIALGLSSNPELENYIDEKTRINCVINYHGEEDALTRIKNSLAQITPTDYNLYLIGYGPARLNIQSDSSQNEETKSNNNVLGLFDSKMLMKSLSFELFASNNSNTELFDSLSSVIKEVTNGRINAITVDKREVLFREIINENEELPWLPLNKLAAGFRNLINIVGDIFIRFSSYQEHSNYKDFIGFVLIDELENHLHPILQRELPASLSKVFPKIQFIASTHSPIPLLGAPKKSVILTVNRSVKLGIEIQRLTKLEKQIHELLPDTILTSAIFNFDYLEKLTNDEFNSLSLEDNYDDIERYKQLNERLKTIDKTIFPDELFNNE